MGHLQSCQVVLVSSILYWYFVDNAVSFMKKVLNLNVQSQFHFIVCNKKSADFFVLLVHNCFDEGLATRHVTPHSSSCKDAEKLLDLVHTDLEICAENVTPS